MGISCVIFLTKQECKIAIRKEDGFAIEERMGILSVTTGRTKHVLILAVGSMW